MDDFTSNSQPPMENNLFQFHFSSLPSYSHDQQGEIAPPLLIAQQPQNYYSYFSDDTQGNDYPQKTAMFSSPQLKPKVASPLQRKRLKTVAGPSRFSDTLSPGLRNGQAKNALNFDDNDNDDEDDELDDLDSDSDSGSNQGSVGSNKKRGKYKIYTDAEKTKILDFMMKHGIHKTLEIFSNNTHKITKRKLKSWIDSQHKIKGVKGRKTNDPNRDQLLYDWCIAFQHENGRAPTRKEATKKALELSEDPSFQASKGWLDKFSRKFNIEFTPLKIIPPKNKLKNGLFDSDSGSAVSDISSFDGMSPLLQAMQTTQPQQQGESANKFWSLESSMVPQEGMNDENQKVNSYFSFQNSNSNNNGMNNDRRDSISFLEPQSYYNQSQNNFNPGYGYPSNFQNYSNNYQKNFSDNFNHLQYSTTSQPQFEVNEFLNFGVKTENQNNNGFQMKFENSY